MFYSQGHIICWSRNHQSIYACKVFTCGWINSDPVQQERLLRSIACIGVWTYIVAGFDRYRESYSFIGASVRTINCDYRREVSVNSQSIVSFGLARVWQFSWWYLASFNEGKLRDDRRLASNAFRDFCVVFNPVLYQWDSNCCSLSRLFYS